VDRLKTQRPVRGALVVGRRNRDRTCGQRGVNAPLYH
jgi:hypothetical protein